MDDCPIPFGARLPSPPELLPLGFLWNYQDPNLVLGLTFDVDMDTAFTPDPADFILLVDAVPKTILAIAWANNRVLEVTYDQAVLAPSVIRLELPESKGTFHAADLCPVSPFDQLGIEQTPTAKWDASDPDFIITIEMAFDLIELDPTSLAPWLITFAGFSDPPDAADVAEGGAISLLIPDENPPGGILDAEFQSFNVDYKDENGLWLVPFIIENILEAD